MSQENKYSPGPWKHRLGDFAKFEDSDGNLVLWVFQQMPATPAADRRTQANRRLLGNAPETFEALLHVTDELDSLISSINDLAGSAPYDAEEALAKAKAVIAKVEGT